jgi:Tol biopolymer transport system component
MEEEPSEGLAMQGRHIPSVLAFAVLCALRLHAAGIPEPELVGEGTLSTSDDELGAAFTPDGKTVYFTLRSPTTATAPLTTICVSHLLDAVDTAKARWSEPEVAPFSGQFNDAGPALSPDGKHLFFASDRPAPGKAAEKSPQPGQPDIDLWMMDRTADGWSAPRNLGTPVNTPAVEQSPAVAADGTLYFASSRPGGKGSLDLYRSRFAGGRYTEPETLVEMNTEAYEGQPAISQDGSLLVFAAAGRPDNFVGGGFPYQKGDLYVSVRTAKGWSPPRLLPPPINSKASDSSPSFSPDGKWLYFTSERSPFTVPMSRQGLSARQMATQLHSVLSGSGNLYRIDAAVLRALAAPAKEME